MKLYDVYNSEHVTLPDVSIDDVLLQGCRLCGNTIFLFLNEEFCPSFAVELFTLAFFSDDAKVLEFE